MANYYINATGPLGDGSGSSAANAADASTAAKFNAINQAQNVSGTTIVYAPGTYLMTPSVSMFNGITHQGAGIDQTIVKAANGSGSSFSPMWYGTSPTISNFKVFDMTVDFNANNTAWWTAGTGSSIAFDFPLADHCTIQRVKFINIGSKNNESFPIYAPNGSAASGNINNVLIDSCIFTQPIVSGNTAGLTCINITDVEPNITIDNTTIVSNCQFLDLFYPTHSDLQYTQCISAPVAQNNYARDVDNLWYVEPGSASSGNNTFFPGITVQVTGNTLVNSGYIARIFMHPNGSVLGNLNIQNNTVGMCQQPSHFFGNTTPQGVIIDDNQTGNPSIGNVTITGNTFIAPLPLQVSPLAANINPQSPNLYHLASLTITNNKLINFPESGNANVGAQWQINAAQAGTYTNSGNTFAVNPAPTLVQHVSTCEDQLGTGYWANAVAGSPYKVKLPNPTIGGNCLILGMTYPNSAGSVTVSDDKANSWALAKTTNNGSITSAAYIALNIALSTTVVTISFSTPSYNCQFCLSEFFNVASGTLATVLEGSNGGNTSSTVSSGSFTPSSSGDLIYHYGYDTAISGTPKITAITNMTPGSGFTLLSADIMLGTFSQYTVQSVPAAINPSLSVTGSADVFNSIGIALRSAVQGSAPSASCRIVHHNQILYTRAGVAVIFPSQGSLLLVGTSRNSGSINVAGMSSNPANTWIESSQAPIGPGTLPSQTWFATNAATSLTATITPNCQGGSQGSGAGPNGTTLFLYDVAGAGALDTAAGYPTAYIVTSTANQTLTNFPSITPSQANGFVFTICQCSFGPPGTINSPAGGILETTLYGGQVDNDLMDNADIYAHYFNPNTTTINFGYTMNSSSSSSEQRAIAFAFLPLGGVITGSPTLIQHVATGMDCLGVLNFIIPLPNLTLSGNCLILGIQFKSAGTISSVTDNTGNTWILGPTVTNATYGQTMVLYYALNIAAGTRVVTVAFSGIGGVNTAAITQAVLSEWNNIATAAATDGSSFNATSVTSGSFTPSQPNDLIYHWGIAFSTSVGGTNGGGTFNGASLTAGSGFTLLSADLQAGSCDQYLVQSSAATINPTFTFAPTGSTWGSVALALKSAPTGTLPGSGIRIVHTQHTLIGANSTTGNALPLPLQFPCTGNLLVGAYNYTQVTSVTSTPANTWSLPASLLCNNTNWGAIYAQIFYAANATTSTNLSGLTLTLGAGSTSGQTFQSFLVLYDIAGASASPFDVGATLFGRQTANGNLDTVSITPSTANGLVIGHTAIDFQTITGSLQNAGATYLSDTVVNTQEDDNPAGPGTSNSPLDEDNGIAHVYNTNTSTLKFSWTVNTALSGGSGQVGVQFWNSVAAAFKASGAVSSFNPITVTLSGTASTLDVAALEYSGISSTVPVDTASSNTGTSTAPSTGPFTAHTIPDVLLSACTSSGGPLSAGSGFSQITLGPRQLSEQQIVSRSSPVFVQGNWAVNAATVSPISTSFPNAQTAGHCVLAWVICNSVGVTISSVSDTAGNTYSIASGPITDSQGQWQITIYICKQIVASSSGNTFTANFSASTWSELIVGEYASVDAVNPIDSTSSSQGQGTSGSSTIATVGSQTLVISWLVIIYSVISPPAPGNPNPVTIPAGWSLEKTTYSTGSAWLADKATQAPTSYSPTWSFSSNTWQVVNIALLGAVTPGSYSSTASTNTSAPWVMQTLALQPIATGVNLNLSGIASNQAFGLVRVDAPASLALSGIASSQAFGVGTVNAPASLNLSGLASAGALGLGHVDAPANPMLLGIASTESFGIGRADAPASLALTGMGSNEAFGVGRVDAPAQLSLSGIPTTQAFGTIIVSTTGSTILALSGIPSAEAFGTMTATATGTATVNMQGITSGESFGTPTISGSGTTFSNLSGIPSSESFGTGAVSTVTAQRMGRIL